MKNALNLLNFFAAFLLALTGNAQLSASAIQQFVTVENNLNRAGLIYPSLVVRFYEICEYESTWLGGDKSLRLAIFSSDLDRASDFGLDRKGYQFKFIEELRLNTNKLENSVDSIIADLRITDAAIHFYGEIKNGNIVPFLKYNAYREN